MKHITKFKVQTSKFKGKKVQTSKFKEYYGFAQFA